MTADDHRALRLIPRDTEAGSDLADASAADRIGVMWQLAIDAWTFMGEAERAQSPFQRHVVRVIRGGR